MSVLFFLGRIDKQIYCSICLWVITQNRWEGLCGAFFRITTDVPSVKCHPTYMSMIYWHTGLSNSVSVCLKVKSILRCLTAKRLALVHLFHHVGTYSSFHHHSQVAVKILHILVVFQALKATPTNDQSWSIKVGWICLCWYLWVKGLNQWHSVFAV